MKLWKKVTCAALCMLLALGALTACDELTDDSTGAGSDTQSSVNQDTGSGDENTDSGSGDEEAKEVKSFKAEGIVEISNVSKYFIEGTQEFDPEQTSAYENTSTFLLELTQMDDGTYETHYKMTTPFTLELNGEPTDFTGVNELIVKDGVIYEREYAIPEGVSEDLILATDEALWSIVEIEVDPEALKIMALLEKVVATDEAQDFMAEIAILCQQIIDEEIIPNIPEDGNVAFEYDFASDINTVVDAIEAIDETTTTLGDIIDGVLVEIDPELTAEAVLELIASYKDYTVGEALTDIDLALAEYDTSLQDIYDNIVKSEIVEVIVTDELVGMPAEDFAAMKEFKIAMIAEEYGAITFGELVNMVVEEFIVVEEPTPVTTDEETTDSEVTEEEPPVDYFAEYLEMAGQMLDMTLADLGVMIPEIPVTFNQLEILAAAQFNETLEGIDSAEIEANIGVEIKIYKEEKTTVDGTVTTEVYAGVQYSTVSAIFSVVALDEVIKIQAPAADKINSESETLE